MKPSRLLKTALFIAAVCGLSLSAAQATTYYIDPNGNNANGCTNNTTDVCQTLDRVWAVDSSGGDTVVMGTGTYTATGNEFDAGIPVGSNWTTPTIIQAASTMNVVLNGAVSFTTNRSNYIEVRGIVFNNTSQDDIYGAELKFKACGFKGGATSGNDSNISIGTNNFTPGAKNILLEDCFVVGLSTGSGRYQVQIYEAQNVVIRRMVNWIGDGWDDGGSTNPSANFVVYNSSYTSLQNCLVIDSTAPPDTYQGAFYRVNNSGQSFYGDFNEWLGVMALNNAGYGFYSDINAAGPISSATWRDSVIVDPRSGGLSFGWGGNFSVLAERLTLMYYNETGSGTDRWAMGDGNSGTNVTRNVIAANWATADFNGVSPTYFVTYNNGSTTAGTGQITTNPLTIGCSYPIRIEAGSTLKTAGSSGGQIGAQIVYKTGTDGTLYGDSGSREVTANALWPWPYETQIKEHLCGAYSYGVCGTTLTLTRYVWEYFDKPIPSDIYSTDTSSPTAPTNVSTTAVTSASISWTWTASTDDVGVSGYKYDLATDSGFSSLVVNNTDNGSATTVTTSGLSASTQYFMRVRAYDATGNTSDSSSTGNGTTSEVSVSSSNGVILGSGRITIPTGASISIP